MIKKYIKKVAYKLLNKYSPGFANLIKFCWLLANTLDLNRLINPSESNDADNTNHLIKTPEIDALKDKLLFLTFFLHDMGKRKSNASQPIIAVLSPLPPENTGIADYTVYAFGHDVCTDFFGDYKKVDDFIAWHYQKKNKNAQFYDIGSYIFAIEQCDYAMEIFALGNSPHNKKVATTLFQSPRKNNKRVLYLHDLCLFDILHSICGLMKLNYLHILQEAYQNRVDTSKTENCTIDQLLDRNIRAIKPFVQKGKVDEIWVNSFAAEQIVKNDLNGLSVPIKVTFLPMPTYPTIDPIQPSDTITIGTFGLPGDGKETAKIIEAVHDLVKKAIKIRLIVAGYQVNAFFKENPHLLYDFIDCYDAPSTDVLMTLMQTCDLAIQLRKSNFGESSGVIPQLLALKKDVIVTNIGAFREYHAVARLVSPGISEKELADVIEHELCNCGSRLHAINAFVDERKLANFTAFVNEQCCNM